MLTAGICNNFYKLRQEVLDQEGVDAFAISNENSDLKTQSQASVARVSGHVFIANPKLHEEVFGPFSLLVICENTEEMYEAISHLKGQLTASLMADESEACEYPGLIQLLSKRAGRVIINGVPTGVEVCPSMHHGGPFPSATDARFTSVGRHSILRFVRPQSYQNWPDALLPDELKNANPLGINRLINNVMSGEKLENL